MEFGNLQDGNVGKYLRTRCRLIFKGGIYHVTQRAPGDEKLFKEDRDYLKFISLIKETSKEFSITIFSFSLLPNHLHLLLQIKEKNLSEAMKFLFGSYAMYFNLKHERKGHAFCGPFRASVIDDDQYFLAACVYIHLNAYRAGCCDSCLRYRWHSLDVYLEKVKTESFVNCRKICGLLSQDDSEGRMKYRQLLEHTLNKGSGVISRFNQIEEDIKKEMRQVRKFLGIDDPVQKGPRNGLIREFLTAGYSRTEILAKLGISRATFFRSLQDKS